METKERDNLRTDYKLARGADTNHVGLIAGFNASERCVAAIPALLDELDSAEKENTRLRTTIGGIHEAIFDNRDVTKWKIAEWLNKALAKK